jgi:hypothetical protein
MWRQGLARDFINKQMPGDLYKRWRSTNITLGGYVKIAHLTTKFKKHEQGSNQGAPLSADEWTLYMESVANKMQDLPSDALIQMPTLTTGNEKEEIDFRYVDYEFKEKWKDVYLYIDDASLTPALTDQRTRVNSEVTKKMEEVADDKRFSWAPTKTQFTVLGRKDELVGTTSGKLLDKKFVDTKSVLLLGEILETKLYGGTEQFKSTLKKLQAPARAISWVCKSKHTSSIHLLKMLITSRLMSRIRVGMALQQINEKQIDRLRAVIALQIKRSLGLPTQVSARPLLAELGIMDPQQELELETLRIFGRASRKSAGMQVAQMLKIRKQDIENGENIGIYPAIHKLLIDIGLEHVWSIDFLDTAFKENKWKEEIDSRMGIRANKIWKKYGRKHGKTHNNYQHYKKTVIQEGYLTCGNPLQVALVLCLKLGALRLRGSKWRDEKVPETHCELCGKKHELETADHLLLECEEMFEERQEMLIYLDKCKGSNKWRTDKKKRSIKTVLLSSWLDENNAKTLNWEKKKDKALKKFLIALWEKFKHKTGRDILSSAHFTDKDENNTYQQQIAVVANNIFDDM